MSRHSDTGTGDWLMSAVSRNPEGLLLLAAGAALLLRSGMSRNGRSSGQHMTGQRGGQYGGQRSMQDRDEWEMPRGVSRAAESARGYAESARDYASGMTSRVADTATSYASAVSDYASETGRAVYEQSGRYARQAQSTVSDTVSRVVQDQPLAIALAGLAAGAAVAAAFPATDLERRTLGPAGEKLTDYVGQTGEQLRNGAMRAGERLMDAVEERGLSTEGLKDAARDAAGAFREGFSGQQSAGGASGQQGAAGAASKTGSGMSGGSKSGSGTTPGRTTSNPGSGRSDISGSGA